MQKRTIFVEKFVSFLHCQFLATFIQVGLVTFLPKVPQTFSIIWKVQSLSVSILILVQQKYQVPLLLKTLKMAATIVESCCFKLSTKTGSYIIGSILLVFSIIFVFVREIEQGGLTHKKIWENVTSTCKYLASEHYFLKKKFDEQI